MEQIDIKTWKRIEKQEFYRTDGQMNSSPVSVLAKFEAHLTIS